jgi:hypothetical protein
VNVIHLCAHHFLDICSFIEDVIAMHNTHIFFGQIEDVSSFQHPVICCLEGDRILQDEVMCIRQRVGLGVDFPDDLVEALHH